MKWILILIVLTSLCSCTNKSKVPSDVIPKQKMELVLWDMIKADRFAVQYILRDSLVEDKETKRFETFELVFQVHDISSQEFIHSMKFYMSRPDLTKVLLDTISARANRSKAELFSPTLQ